MSKKKEKSEEKIKYSLDYWTCPSCGYDMQLHYSYETVLYLQVFKVDCPYCHHAGRSYYDYKDAYDDAWEAWQRINLELKAEEDELAELELEKFERS